MREAQAEHGFLEVAGEVNESGGKEEHHRKENGIEKKSGGGKWSCQIWLLIRHIYILCIFEPLFRPGNKFDNIF